LVRGGLRLTAVFLSPLRGWSSSPAFTHGLRRGLHSIAALRLGSASWRACGASEEAAEKLGFRLAAPKGAIDNAAVTVCLKAYPDTNLEFFRGL
jgi:hypothetical protein